MSMGAVRVSVVLAGCLWLAACATDSTNNPTNNSNFFTFPSLFRPSAEAEATGSTDTTAFPSPDKVIPTTVTPSEPNDDLSLAKENFREGNYGLAERYFRKAVEAGPRDAEAWLGLAASYDRIKRFDLADRAYNEVLRIAGPTPEILNNQGYSYMLRGDFIRARKILLDARAKDPNNSYIKNNLALLEDSVRTRKAVR
jgi:tetratricopeptide (TPR) repeat protein